MSIIEKAIEKAGAKGWNQTPPKQSHVSENKKKIFEEKLAEEISSETVFSDKLENAHSVEKNNIKSTTADIISINREKLFRQGFLDIDNSGSEMVEEYRIIKRPLVNNAFGAQKEGIKRANLILITSSVPSEGKTFTAVNLALSLASERDKKVLLVDADVANPCIGKLLGINNQHGLIDYLDGEDLDFAKMMVKTDIPGFSFIPAGKKHSFSTELLASHRMEILVDELHARYADRIVIFDSPPLLAATQAEVLASLVGQVILVVEAEITNQSLVAESINKLKVCDVVLTLLNKSTRSLDAKYFGYSSYGQYGR
jgi:protein-tyrosine kinase